jgi:hypothetical protein
MELTEEMKAFLDAVDAGYKRENVTPVSGISQFPYAGQYYVCGAMAAYMHKVNRTEPCCPLSLPAWIADTFNVPRPFISGFIAGFDRGLLPSNWCPNEVFQLGYDNGVKKNAQYIRKTGEANDRSTVACRDTSVSTRSG